MKYTVTLNAYCGMDVPIYEDDEISGGDDEVALIDGELARLADFTDDDILTPVAAAVRDYLCNMCAAGHPVVRLGEAEWEVQEEDGACMVSDDCGILSVEKVRGRVCDECDTELEQDGRLTWYCTNCDCCSECAAHLFAGWSHEEGCALREEEAADE